MSIIMGFSVYSLRISNDLPVQSDNIPKITAFFLESILINLFAISWFIQLNYFKSNEYFPKLYTAISECFKKLIHLSFHQKKITNKILTAPSNNKMLTEPVNEIKTENNCKFCVNKEINNLSEKMILESNFKLINFFCFLLTCIFHIIFNLVLFIN